MAPNCHGHSTVFHAIFWRNLNLFQSRVPPLRASKSIPPLWPAGFNPADNGDIQRGSKGQIGKCLGKSCIKTTNSFDVTYIWGRVKKNKTNLSQHVMDNHSSRHGQTAWWSVRNQIPSNTNSPGCNRLVRTPIFDGHIIVWWTTQILVSVPIFGNKSTSLLVKPLFSFPTCWFFAPNNSDTVKS